MAAMTKQVFIAAARQVHSILQGEWTDEPPAWADDRLYYSLLDDDGEHETETPSPTNYVRAVQTAEAYIILFRAFNSRFDEKRFLIACGLDEVPAKPKRARKASVRRRVISDEDAANARPGTENE